MVSPISDCGLACATMEPTKLPPVGHYPAYEVAQLAGVSGDRIGQWARYGYICSSQSDGPPRIYSYQDVAKKMPGHGVICQAVKQDLRQIAADLRRGGWASRELPELEHIEVNPQRLSGRPTIKGRRIPARFVAQTAHTPGGWDLLRTDFDLETIQIDDAVSWLESVDSNLAAA